MAVSTFPSFLMAGFLAAALSARAAVLGVPHPYATLAAALEVNLEGDTIAFAAGDHLVSTQAVLDRDVTLLGAPGARLLAMAGFLAAGDVHIRGLALRGPADPLFHASGQAIWLEDCRIASTATHGRLWDAADYDGLSLLRCVVEDLAELGPTDRTRPVQLVECRLDHIQTLTSSQHPGLLLEGCLLEEVESFGDAGFVSYDEGELRFHNCTLIDGGGMGTSLDYFELDRCLWIRPPQFLLGEGNLRPDFTEIRQTDLWHPARPSWTGGLDGFQGIYGNIEADPLLCGEVAGDLRLSTGSPCILDAENGVVMGAFPVGCGPLLRSLVAIVVQPGIPARARFVADVAGEVDSLCWDADGDGVTDGRGAEFEWEWDAVGDHAVSLLVFSAFGVDLHVGPVVHVGGRVLPAASVDELEARLDEALPGDRVHLGPGVHTVSGLELGDGVQLTGTPGATVLDGGGSGPILLLEPGGRYRLVRDLEFRGGSAERGGALAQAEGEGPLRVAACRFLDNHAGQEGGALALGTWFSSGPVVLDSCQFEANSATRGGALAARHVVARACTFTGNQASDAGGALLGLDILELADCRLEGNRATWGGAVALDGPGRLERCVLDANEAVEQGGAVWNDPWYSLTGGEYVSCLFTGNRAGMDGAALVDRAGPWLEACTFARDSTAAAGAVVVVGAEAEDDPPRLRRCLLTLARGGRGLSADADALDVSCVDIWGNAQGDWLPPLDSHLGWNGNRMVDPRYCDPDACDFSLPPDSPCGPLADPACGLLGAVDLPCEATVLSPLAPARPAALRLEAPWPNPGNGQCHVRVHREGAGPLRLALYDLLGRRARSWELPAGSSPVLETRLDLGGLAGGLYVLRLEGGAAVPEARRLLVLP